MIKKVSVTLVSILLLSFATVLHSQTTTIKVTVPDKDDEVFITGNSPETGDWDPSKVKMDKVSDREREVILRNITFPLEFKFTRGSWDSEAVTDSYDNPENLIIEDGTDTSYSYTIKGWIDKIDTDESSLRYKMIRLHSEYFNDPERLIKIYVPKNYSDKKKYPVVYTLDGYSLFDVISNYTYQLSKPLSDNIPQCIVVGIYHKDRWYETQPNIKENGHSNNKYLEGSEKLKNHILYELVPYIEKTYSTSGYNILTGHSNTAHFATKMAMEEDNIFNGIIAISVVDDEDFNNKSASFFTTPRNPISYYIAYGTKDESFRQLGILLDTMLKELSAEDINTLSAEFNATHSQMPGISLLPGIRFMFDKYRNFDDFPENLKRNNFNLEAYIKAYNDKILAKYGVNLPLNEEDRYYLLDVIIEEKDERTYNQFIDYERKNRYVFEDYMKVFHYAQMGLYGKAIAEWNIFLDRATSNEEDSDLSRIFYANFRKAIDIYTDNLKQPEEAIDFLERCIKGLPRYRLEFNYFVAKVGVENNLEKKKTKKSLDYCYKHFKENRYFTKDKLDILKQMIK